MYDLKIDKEIIRELRQSDLSIKDRSYSLLILDRLVKRNHGKLEYPERKNLITSFRNSICNNHETIHRLLNFLNDLGLIVFYKDAERNEYNKPKYSAQIDQNFHTNNWYTLTENDIELKYIKAITEKKSGNRIKRQNDSQIGFPQYVLETIKDQYPTYYELFSRKNDGEYLPTEVMKGNTGREYSLYTNMKRDIRKELIDLNTGKKLVNIDITSCQISLALGFIRECFKKPSKQLTEELEILESIQSTISFHTYFEKILLENGINVSRECIKPLVFKMLFGNFNLHDKNYFKKELIEKFEGNGFNIELIWEHFISEFKSRFSNVYFCLRHLSNNAEKKGTTLAAILQRKESEFIISVKALIKKNFKDLPFFTVFDSIYFPEEYKAKIKRLFQKVQHKWKKKNYFIHISTEKEYSKTTPTDKQAIENNNMSESEFKRREFKLMKKVLNSILNERGLDIFSFKPS